MFVVFLFGALLALSVIALIERKWRRDARLPRPEQRFDSRDTQDFFRRANSGR